MYLRTRPPQVGVEGPNLTFGLVVRPRLPFRDSALQSSPLSEETPSNPCHPDMPRLLPTTGHSSAFLEGEKDLSAHEKL